jgi:hypothetical protein
MLSKADQFATRVSLLLPSRVEWPKAPDTARELPGEDFFGCADKASDTLLAESGLGKRIARVVGLTSP